MDTSNEQYDFMTWYHQIASDDEKELCNKVSDFESYFTDMIFADGSASHNLIMAKAYTNGGAELEDFELDIPEQLQYFGPSDIRYKVEELDEDLYGWYQHASKTLCVNKNHFNDESTILHEMIHAYENMVNDFPLFYHDSLFWALYNNLKKCIPNLDTIITDHAHILTGSELFKSGGLHDILFLLKSFDLDIRFDYPLGTIFGYGRIDDFKEYQYNKNLYPRYEMKTMMSIDFNSLPKLPPFEIKKK